MTFPVLSANTPAATGKLLTRSLRLRANASSYLNRTLTTPTDTKKFTWSGWVKRGIVGSAYNIFFNGTPNAYTDFSSFGFSNGSAAAIDSLTFEQYEQGSGYTVRVTTSAVYRDPSAWYHMMVVWDSANATAANRVLIYVNGSQVTSLSTATYPAQNTASKINASSSVNYLSNYSGAYFDGYLAEVNFIDGQALTPSSFGSTNSTTGVWQPARYTGTYGTNGFYLPFTNITSTTTLGYDSSGNGNNWTTNNISLTAGATYDSMTDVPTLTSATASNFAVLNPVFKSNSQPTFSNANLSVSPNTGTYQNTFATIAVTSNKWYCEITVSGTANSANFVGISNATQLNYLATNADVIGSATAGVGYAYYIYNGNKYSNGTSTAYGASIVSGDVIGIAFDNIAGSLTFYKNGTSQGVAFTGISTTDQFFFGSTVYTAGVSSFSWNFGQQPFSYTPPSGFVALNTYNLPASSIPNGAAYMAATTYTGTGASNVITNTVGSASFQPDFVWGKSRSAATNNALYDSVRGAGFVLTSNNTDAETAVGTTVGLSSFNSNGFTMGTGSTLNDSGQTYIGWQWKGGGTAVSNTNGTITSSVSANTTSGCSVVTYTGTGANATVGHGLGVAPSMVIYKRRNSTSDWAVYHVGLTSAAYVIYLDLTIAQQLYTPDFNSTAPTSSVLSVGTSNNTNASGATYVAYCFAAIKGFSAFGSYTGNGVDDGPFVYTGFRPRYVLIKRTDVADNWFIQDTSRNPSNIVNLQLKAQASDAEASTVFDIVSNGFKVRNSFSGYNTSGGTYIYACFAENPFQNSLAR
jgi:hypothetical protein